MNRLNRRKAFLPGTIQPQIIAVNVWYFLVVLLVLAASIFLPLIIQLEDPWASWQQREEVATELLTLHARVWPPLLGVLALFIIHSIFFSHRIAGPLYRFRTVFNDIAKGSLRSPAHIRKHDYLQDEARSINDMILSLQEWSNGLDGQMGELRAAFTEVQRSLHSGSDQGIHHNMKVLEEQLDQLQNHLDHFNRASSEADPIEGDPSERLHTVADNQAATQ